MSVKNIIWDFDGTLVDTYPVITKTYLETSRIDFAADLDYDEVFALCKISLTVCCNELADRFDTTAEEVEKAFLARYRMRTVGVDEPVYRGVLEVCRFVHRRDGLNLLVTHRGRASTEAYGAMGGCREYIADMVAGDDGFPMKPDPTSFIHLMEKYRLLRDETIGVGDRLLDVEAARAAGIASCYFDPEGMRLASGDFNFRDYTELLEWLRSN